MYVFNKTPSLITNGSKDRKFQFKLRMVVVDDKTHPVSLKNNGCLAKHVSTDYVFKDVGFHESMLRSDNWTKLFVYVYACMCGYMLLVVCL